MLQYVPSDSNLDAEISVCFFQSFIFSFAWIFLYWEIKPTKIHIAGSVTHYTVTTVHSPKLIWEDGLF